MKQVKNAATITFALGLFLSCTTLSPAQPPGTTAHERAVKVVERVRTAKISPATAYERGWLDKQALLIIVGDDKLPDPNNSLWNSGMEANRWTGVLLTHFPEILEEIEQQDAAVRIRISLYLRSKGNPRGTQILEKLIGEQSREHPDKRILLAALYILSNYYQGSGQHAKAYETASKVKEYNLTPSEQSNILLGAARALRASGDKESAMVAFEEVVELGYGWASGHAYKEMAELLFSDGKKEEARALLKTPITGVNSDMGMVLTKERLLQSYYADGDWEQARYWAQATIDQFENSGKTVKGMEYFADSARKKLGLIDKLKKSPLASTPDRLELNTAWTTKIVTQRFTISSHRTINVEAMSTHPGVALHYRQYGGSSVTVEAEFDPVRLKGVQKLEIHIVADEFPGNVLRIPITLRPTP